MISRFTYTAILLFVCFKNTWYHNSNKYIHWSGPYTIAINDRWLIMVMSLSWHLGFYRHYLCNILSDLSWALNSPNLNQIKHPDGRSDTWWPPLHSAWTIWCEHHTIQIQSSTAADEPGFLLCRAEIGIPCFSEEAFPPGRTENPGHLCFIAPIGNNWTLCYGWWMCTILRGL